MPLRCPMIPHKHPLWYPSREPNTPLNLPLLNKRNAHPSPLPISHILIPKKLHQQFLLPFNPPRKKPPQNIRKSRQANRIPTQKLRTDAPPEEPEITRVS